MPIPLAPFPGFLRWLRRQAERPAVTGAFARNVARIEAVRRGEFSSLVSLLCFCHVIADDGRMQVALDLALAEWRHELLEERKALAPIKAPAGRPD